MKGSTVAILAGAGIIGFAMMKKSSTQSPSGTQTFLPINNRGYGYGNNFAVGELTPINYNQQYGYGYGYSGNYSYAGSYNA